MTPAQLASQVFSVSLIPLDFESQYFSKYKKQAQFYPWMVWFMCYLLSCQEQTTNPVSFDPNKAFVFHRFPRAAFLLRPVNLHNVTCVQVRDMRTWMAVDCGWMTGAHAHTGLFQLYVNVS